MSEDPRLSRLTSICLGFPEATRELSGLHASFQVRTKTFAWFLSNHHGDGIVSVCCKTTMGEHEEMVEADPGRFYLPAYLAHRGWVALRLDRGEVDWQEVADLVAGSYSLVAPKALAKGRSPGTTG